MSRVLVTGGAGFVGRALIPVLLAKGDTVRVSSRTAGRADLPDPVEVVAVGDLGPDTEWTAALDGIDAVVHLAARVM